jgi:HAMP domain-containing protein
MDVAKVTAPSRARLWERLLARLRGRAIDDRLLSGQPADGNPVTRARLARLTGRRYRAAVARALRGLVEAARRHDRNPFVAQIPLREDEVLESAPEIRTLADELEREDRVSPRGVILAERLITDGGSPIYWTSPLHERAAETVESAVKHARAALHLG